MRVLLQQDTTDTSPPSRSRTFDTQSQPGDSVPSRQYSNEVRDCIRSPDVVPINEEGGLPSTFLLTDDIPLMPNSTSQNHNDSDNAFDEEMCQKDISILQEFSKFILSNVVGRQNFRQKCTRLKLSEIANVSDEAFALVVLENSIEVWTEEKRVRQESLDSGLPTKKKRKGNHLTIYFYSL